jgi:predicted nicotinamide N-methyase
MIPKPVDFCKELIPDPMLASTAVAGPFPLPGGWQTEHVSVGSSTWQLTIPANPDALLDDPDSTLANLADDRMPYWAFVWPAALPMAAAVLQADWHENLRVLELGCGTGLVGLAALARGAHVTLTDYEARAVQLARHNAGQNGNSTFSSRVLDWRKPDSERYPVILGCDLLYQESAFDPLLNLLQRMLEPDGECWLGDGGRSAAGKFWSLVRERGYEVELRGEDGGLRETPVRDFQLFVIRRRGCRR